MSVLLETSLGDVVVDLHVSECPATTRNFLKLCKLKRYNFCCFYNVQRDYIAQTGDPTATGKEGQSVYGLLAGVKPGYFKDEIRPKLKHARKGTVAMANLGPDLNDSRFFITLADNLHELDGKHTIFGQVAEGLEVLDQINAAFCDDAGRPYKDIRIRHTVILDDPFDDPDGLVAPERSPSPTPEQLATVRLGDDDDTDPTEGMTEDEREKYFRRKEAKAHALTLEMVGDLPFADVKPPENVLFVCKLNPVTRDEDLELIFSRFGPIASTLGTRTAPSAQVIRDFKTGDSLCYAFIEFENQKDCEEAYLKMDNVLIDDRRIHVDFSQSVSKLQMDWRRGRELTGVGKGVELKRKFQPNAEQDKYQLVFDHDAPPASSSGRGTSSSDQRGSASADAGKPKKRRWDA